MLGRNLAVALNGPAATQLRPLANNLPMRLSIRLAPSVQQRFYATPGRPKKAVGETSRPIKRATKKPASESIVDKNEKAKQAVAKKAAAKKAADKKKEAEAAQKLKASLAKAKEKEKIKAAAAAAKQRLRVSSAKAKEKQRKVKAAAAADQAKAKAARPLSRSGQLKLIRELKVAALDPPKVPSSSMYREFLTENINKLAVGASLPERTKAVSEAYKSLTLDEREHYNHLAHTAVDKAQAARRAWILDQSPEEIIAANKARAKLRGILKQSGKLKQGRYMRIVDERGSKRPTSFLVFSSTRMSSPDFKHMNATERMRLIGQEWRALDEGEKQKYGKIAASGASASGDEPDRQQAAAAA